MRPDLLEAPLDRLQQQPWRYTFFQALRLLRRSGGKVHCSSSSGLSFPAGEIADLEESAAGGWRLRVNFLGLTGPCGVLPRHYSQWLDDLERHGEHAAGEFLDLFEQRLLELFWRAWTHHRADVSLELGLPHRPLDHVFDFIGLGTPLLRPTNRPIPTLPAAALAFYSGLIAQRPHGTGSIAQIMSDWLGAQVRVQSCLGTWQRIAPQRRSRLGRGASRLADDCQLGSHYWDCQGTLRLVVGPLSNDAFESLLPCAPGRGERLQGAMELSRFLTGLALDLRICLALAAHAVPQLRLGQSRYLGWNTWLAGQAGGRPRERAAEHCEFRFNATGEQSWRQICMRS